MGEPRDYRDISHLGTSFVGIFVRQSSLDILWNNEDPTKVPDDIPIIIKPPSPPKHPRLKRIGDIFIRELNNILSIVGLEIQTDEEQAGL